MKLIRKRKVSFKAYSRDTFSTPLTYPLECHALLETPQKKVFLIWKTRAETKSFHLKREIELIILSGFL